MGYRESFEEICDWRDEQSRVLAGAALVHAIEERIEREADPRKRRMLRYFLAREYKAQGDSAAAKAVFDQDPVHQIEDWHLEFSRTHNGPETICAIEEKIRNESDPMVLRALNFALGWEYRGVGDYTAYEAVSLRMFDAEPDEPVPLISLAEHKLLVQKQPEAAMPIIDRAIEVAFRSGIFRRHALATKARIALDLAQYHVVEEILRQIMQLEFGRGNADIGVERDFYDRLPPGSIDADVARQYDAFCRAKGKLPAGG